MELCSSVDAPFLVGPDVPSCDTPGCVMESAAVNEFGYRFCRHHADLAGLALCEGCETVSVLPEDFDAVDGAPICRRCRCAAATAELLATIQAATVATVQANSAMVDLGVALAGGPEV